MTTRELLRWSRLHERRAASWWSSRWIIALVAGGALAAFVEWRARTVGIGSASASWLAGTLLAFALAFLRVPFHLYWRADAPLLAQLPIPGGALLDVALVRCVRAAAATTLAVVIGAVPLGDAFVHHAIYAGVLGVSAAGLLPAVAIGAAAVVATDQRALAQGGAVLGALPGFAATAVIVVVLIASPFLLGHASAADVAPELGGLAAASVLALVAARASGAKLMGTILRDVSALDRQRLATLEIKPPTAIERAIGSMIGDAALPYGKDARLMRRRYPMAFALGSLAFVVLVIVGLARPHDPAPWLVATLAGAALYALALAGRLKRPPIELPRLSATLPITASSRRRAKIAWLAGWLVVYVLVPAAFALVRM